jgi:RNA polymerase sigma factor (sigma-70 family)
MSLSSRTHAKPVPLTDDQRGLATRYLPLAQALARRTEKSCRAERDEIESVAYLALVEAASAFDPSYRVNFATYARYHIQGALRDFKRCLHSSRSGPHPVCVPYQDLESHAEEHGSVLGANPDWPVGTELEAVDTVEERLSRLPGSLASICQLIYVHGLSQNQAAEMLGCSKSLISRLHRDALLWLMCDKPGSRDPAHRRERSSGPVASVCVEELPD